MLRHAARILSLTFSMLFFSTQALSARSLDGFVTAVSSTGFDIGGIRIEFATHVRCEIGEVTADPLFYFKHHALGLPLYHPAKAISSPCTSLHIAAGSALHLDGLLQPDGRRFLASRVVLYSITQDELSEGGALVEEEPSVQRNNGGWSGTVQVDGYPLSITPQTRMLAASDDTTLIYSIREHMLTIRAKANLASPETAFSSSLLKPNTWAAYHDLDSGNARNVASQLRFWPNRSSVGETRYRKGVLATINKVKNVPNSIQLRHGNAISILPDRSIQDLVSRVGMELVPLYQKSLPDSDTTKIQFRFYVVRSFQAPFASGLVDINGVLPNSDGAGGFEYHNPAVFTRVNDVIALPNGLVLIPDQVLASLQDEAQLAALLSCSITSVLQKQAYLAQRHSNGFYFAALWLRLNEQALRIGIRQMYLAGYDIREAPFAWAVAQGKPVNNPVIDSKHPNKEIPWYAAYAFSYISKYYKDVDYTKLKRGETEYQDFLKELRAADPEAFVGK